VLFRSVEPVRFAAPGVVVASLIASACSRVPPAGDSAVSPARSDTLQAGQDDTSAIGAAESLVVDGSAPNPPSAGGDQQRPSSASVGDAGGEGGAPTGAPTDPPDPQAGEQASPGKSFPGVTADSIVVSVVAGFGGPYGQSLSHAMAGFDTWRDDVNEAGGIHGRQVVIKRVDHKETADGGVAACREALSNGSFFVTVPQGTEANLTATDCLDRAGMPTIYFAGTTDPSWERAFSYVPTAEAQGRSLPSYIENVLRAGSDKIGTIYANTHAYKAGNSAFVAEAKRRGMSVVGQEVIEANQASFTPQLLRLRDRGAQTVVMIVTVESIGILRDMRSMNWRPRVSGILFVFDFIPAAGRTFFDDVTGLKFSATVESPAFAQYMSRMEARGRGRDRAADLEAFLYYGFGQLVGEFLDRAGPAPTHDSLVAGAETIQNFDTGVLPPITYGEGDHVGTDASFPVVCCHGDYTWRGQGAARSEF
jgi:branched-chain amino acid transport system substrate-binding protein